MTFNISEFKTNMDRYGGLSRNNLFVVEIYKEVPGVGMTSRDLRFFCKAVNLPGVDITTQDYKPNGFGLSRSIPIGLNQSPVNAVFMLDSRHQVLSFFHRWAQQVVNYDSSGGILTSVNNQTPYEVGYTSEFSANIIIRHYTADNPSTYYEYRLNKAYPTQVSDLDVSWEDNDSYSTVTVNFTYSGFSYTGSQRGDAIERNSRGTGYIDSLNAVGSTYQALSTNNFPNSVQDAIDAFTSFGNSVNNLSSDNFSSFFNNLTPSI